MPHSLLININNSFTKAAQWDGARLKPLGRIPSNQIRRKDFNQWITRAQAQQILVSSVVPPVTEKFRAPAKTPCYLLNHKSPWGIQINFPRPSSIGADRLANAAAVNAFYTVPAVVIDYGTAVTFDIISKQGEYLGGVITPGMRIFQDYLAERTALLPRIKVTQPDQVVGKSTRDAMRSGAYYGYRGLVKEILQEIKRELGAKRLAIIATGGDSSLFQNEADLFDIHDPDLSFKGMSVAADHYLS
ncbi:MAG: type III pantothenate kinase [Gammaproteobacteria bacterium]|nr:type III pantothenate kinase [Gammaproteobacteria bacterium]